MAFSEFSNDNIHYFIFCLSLQPIYITTITKNITSLYIDNTKSINKFYLIRLQKIFNNSIRSTKSL